MSRHKKKSSIACKGLVRHALAVCNRKRGKQCAKLISKASSSCVQYSRKKRGITTKRRRHATQNIAAAFGSWF